MSPDLEKLLEAFYEKRTSSPDEKNERDRAFDRLLDEILASHPGLSRHALLEAVQSRYHEFRRARRKPPTMPPNA